MKHLINIALFSTLCVAQATFNSATIKITNHGGWGLSVNVGSNKGDAIRLDVKCDHTIQGECFIATPKLASGQVFSSVPCPTCGDGHQQWLIYSPTTGDQFVTAQYGWIGADVHYWIKIIATEKL